MPMPMVQIRIVRMRVLDRCVHMGMRVRFMAVP